MENYKSVIRVFLAPASGPVLAPASGEREAQTNKTEAHDHVPRSDIRNWVGGRADVEDNDPDQASQKGGDHDGSKPLWALLGKGRSDDCVSWDVLLFLLATT